jgi:hypothetical protein
MIETIKDQKQRKKIEAIASRLCTEEIAKVGAVVDIMDLGKLAAIAQQALTAGRTQDGTREEIQEWLARNRKDIASTAKDAKVGSRCLKRLRVMIMFLDYTDLPRAWGVADNEQDAEAEARRQLQSYCAKQKALGEIDLADQSKYTMRQSTVEQ